MMHGHTYIKLHPSFRAMRELSYLRVCWVQVPFCWWFE